MPESLPDSATAVLPAGESKKMGSIFGEVLELTVQANEIRGCLPYVEHVIERPWFESFYGAMILANALVMAFEGQYNGLQLAIDFQYEEHSASTMTTSAPLPVKADMWPGAPIVFEMFGWIFGIVFSVECVLKLIGQRCRYVCHVWNWIDLSLVLLWLASVLGALLPIDPNLVRLARLARLLRLLKVARSMKGMDSLYLITTSLGSSFSILAWTIVLFLILQITVALLISSIVSEYYLNDLDAPLEKRKAVFIYFGTITRATFSLFELTLANWPPIIRVLSENVSEVFMLLGVMHKLTVGFAFVGVVNGVFMQETFKVAKTDNRNMVRQKQRDMETHFQKMKMFFNQSDVSGDGMINFEEFVNVVSQQEAQLWLSAMELDEKDHRLLFSLLDNGDGQIELDELVKGVGRLKGAAKSIDVIRIMRELESMQQTLKQIEQRC